MYRHSEIDALARLALSAGNLGTWRWDTASDMVIANDTYLDLMGWQEGAQLHPLTQLLDSVAIEDSEAVRDWLDHVKNDNTRRIVEYRIHRTDGQVRWLRGTAERLPVEEGESPAVRGVVWDVTTEAMRDLVSELALSAGRMGRWQWDLIAGRTQGDPMFARLMGIDPTAKWWPSDELLDKVHADDRLGIDTNLRTAFAEGTFFQGVFRIRTTHDHHDDELRWVESRGQIIRRDQNGRPTEMVGVIMDCDDRIRQARELERMHKDLNHRIKNLFSVIGSLVKISRRLGDDKDETLQKLEGRIAALAAGHAVGIDGRGRPVNMAEFLRQILTPYLWKGFDIQLDGPPVELPTRMLTPLSILCNELASNAEHHGCWKGGAGRLKVSWSELADDDCHSLDFHWHEVCDDPAEALNRSDGFGLLLVRQSAAQLGARFSFQLTDNGVNASLRCPLTPNLE